MQSVSSRIWTRVAVSISYDDNHYTTGTSKSALFTAVNDRYTFLMSWEHKNGTPVCYKFSSAIKFSFYFSLTGCLTNAKKLNVPYYLPIYIYIYIYNLWYYIVLYDVLYIITQNYTYIRGSLNKFPDFFRMGTFLDSIHMKL